MQFDKDTLVQLHADVLNTVVGQVLVQIGLLNPDIGGTDPQEVSARGWFILTGRITDFDHHFGPTIRVKAANGDVHLTLPWAYVMAVVDAPAESRGKLGF